MQTLNQPTTLAPQISSARDVLATVAAELAAGIEEPQAIFAKFDISSEEARVLLQNPNFRQLVKQAQKEWATLDNTEKRVRYKALVAVEELMPSMFQVVRSSDTPASSRNETFKSFMRLAGLEKAESSSGGSGGGFSITINLPSGSPQEIQGAVLEATTSEESDSGNEP